MALAFGERSTSQPPRSAEASQPSIGSGKRETVEDWRI